MALGRRKQVLRPLLALSDGVGDDVAKERRARERDRALQGGDIWLPRGSDPGECLVEARVVVLEDDRKVRTELRKLVLAV